MAPVAEGGLGVSLVYTEFKRWTWLFRNLLEDDWGLDAEVEPKRSDYASGRLIKLQIKTGKAGYFNHPAPGGEGWFYVPKRRRGRNPNKHLRYWLEHDVRVVLILVDETTEEIYWQHVTLDRVIFTGASWKILVPRGQKLDSTARNEFDALLKQPHVAVPDIVETSSRSLPARCHQLIRDAGEVDHFKALQLAATLARGSDDPEATAAKLLDKDARYVKGADGLLLAALAAYASDHHLPAASARALRRAAAYGGPLAGRRHAYAAWNWVLDGDPTQARGALDEAVALGADPLLCAWIGSAVDQPAPGFLVVPDEVASATEAVANQEIMYRVFLADWASARGDLDTALRHMECAREVEPESSSVAVALARLYLARAASDRSTNLQADLARAIALCTWARDEQRRWHGPSHEAVAEMVSAYLMADDIAAAVRVAAPAPAGEAIMRESRSPLVAFQGARAAMQVGNREIAQQIADACGEDSVDADAVRLVVAGSADPVSVIADWSRVLRSATVPAVLRCGAAHLAEQAVWPIDALDRMAAAGEVSEEEYSMLHARALVARGDLGAGLQLLRPLAAVSPIAAQMLTEVLQGAGRVEDALAACTRAYAKFISPGLGQLLWHLLRRLERVSEASDLAVALLARGGLAPLKRTALRVFLASRAATAEDWQTVEEQCAAALEDGDEQARPLHWPMIDGAFRQGRITLAWNRLRAFDPPITMPGQAALWITLHAYFGFDGLAAVRALDLADQFPDNEALQAQITHSLLTRGNKRDAQGRPILPQAAPGFAGRFDALLHARHARTQPDLVRMPDVESAVDKSREHLSARAGFDAYVEDLVHRRVLSLRAKCQLFHQPYARSLFERMVGPIPAFSALSAEFDQEAADVLRSIEGEISIDPSALAVAAEIPEQWQRMFAAFTTVSVSQDDYHACLSACADMRLEPDSAAHLSYDAYRQNLVYTEITAEETQRRRERAERVERFLPMLEIYRAPRGESQEMARPQDRPWIIDVTVHVRPGSGWWCDDVVLRANARAAGIPTFGTLALLHSLLRRDNREADLQTIELNLARAEIVDLSLDAAGLVALAADALPYPGPAYLHLGRLAFWLDNPKAVAALLRALDMAGEGDSESAAAWVAGACQGLAYQVQDQNLRPALDQLVSTVIEHRRSENQEAELLRAVANSAIAVERARRTLIVSTLEKNGFHSGLHQP